MDDDRTDKRIAPFGLRMPPDLKARVQAAADASNRSMNAEIVATLEEKYPAPMPKNEPANVRVWLDYLTEDVAKGELKQRQDYYQQTIEAYDRTGVWRPPPAEWLREWLRRRGQFFSSQMIQELIEKQGNSTSKASKRS